MECFIRTWPGKPALHTDICLSEHSWSWSVMSSYVFPRAQLSTCSPNWKIFKQLVMQYPTIIPHPFHIRWCSAVGIAGFRKSPFPFTRHIHGGHGHTDPPMFSYAREYQSCAENKAGWLLILHAEHLALASEKITLETKVENNGNTGSMQLHGKELSCLV